MGKDRIKEINHLIWLKSELIKQSKKEVKALVEERRELEGQKVLKRQQEKDRHNWNRK